MAATQAMLGLTAHVIIAAAVLAVSSAAFAHRTETIVNIKFRMTF
jgi:hypothetical protein